MEKSLEINRIGKGLVVPSSICWRNKPFLECYDTAISSISYDCFPAISDIDAGTGRLTFNGSAL